LLLFLLLMLLLLLLLATLRTTRRVFVIFARAITLAFSQHLSADTQT
jgi:hypothetical protein